MSILKDLSCQFIGTEEDVVNFPGAAGSSNSTIKKYEIRHDYDEWFLTIGYAISSHGDKRIVYCLGYSENAPAALHGLLRRLRMGLKSDHDSVKHKSKYMIELSQAQVRNNVDHSNLYSASFQQIADGARLSADELSQYFRDEEIPVGKRKEFFHTEGRQNYQICFVGGDREEQTVELFVITRVLPLLDDYYPPVIKKKSPEKATESNTYVTEKTETIPARFYYELCIIVTPPKLPGSRLSGKKINDYCEFLGESIQDELPANFDDIQFRKYQKRRSGEIVASFSVSRCHEYLIEDICRPRTGYAGIFIKEEPFIIIRDMIMQEINNSISNQYNVSSLEFRHVSSRNYVYEYYFEGSVTVKKGFSPDELAEGVSIALEWFFEEMKSDLTNAGFDGYCSHTTKKRNKNDTYVFELSYTLCICHNEKEVLGPMSLFDHNVTLDEVYGLVGMGESILKDTGIINSLEYAILNMCLPQGADLVDYHFELIDQDDDIYDCSDLLIIHH